MAKKKNLLNLFKHISWNDLTLWSGYRIADRGRNYQRDGRVSDLKIAGEAGIIAWVDGTEKYAVQVTIGEDGDLDALCTCPYGLECKHAVAAVLEYLDCLKTNTSIPNASKKDQRFRLLDDAGDHLDSDDYAIDYDDDALDEEDREEIQNFLNKKTKKQIIDLVVDLANRYPEIYDDIIDQKHLSSGDKQSLIHRTRSAIAEIREEPGWQSHWSDEGYTPDYSKIRNMLSNLLEAGYADDVIALGKELMESGTSHVEESHDEGETADEIYRCMPIIAQALQASSLSPSYRLIWAIEALVEDEFNLFEPLIDFLNLNHSASDWSIAADHLMTKLSNMKANKQNDFSFKCRRETISDWAIHALNAAGRSSEIIPLCQVEAVITQSYERLVRLLIEDEQYENAETWIFKGLESLRDDLPGITSNLRSQLIEIRSKKCDWPLVAALQIDEFVRYPSLDSFQKCIQPSKKVKSWTRVRQHLLSFLETGTLPWKQEHWPLPIPFPEPAKKPPHKNFPLIDVLIDIAIEEKNPEQVLLWYDQRPKLRYGWHGLDEDRIATAVQNHSPDRSVTIWKQKAERNIAVVKPSAYERAAIYLRKAGKLMKKLNRQKEWADYLAKIRADNFRKRRLLEILDGMDDSPIFKKN